MAEITPSRILTELDEILALVTPGSGVIPPLSQDPFNELSTGISTISRSAATSATGQVLSNQALILTYFTATKSITSTKVRMYTGGTAAGATPTLVRAGLYSADAAGAGTLIASFASDTALFAAANTAYEKTWTTPVNLVRGTRYALGILVVTAATAPNVIGHTFASGATTGQLLAGMEPVMARTVSGQADLPASFAAGATGVQGGRTFAVVLP